MGGVGLAILLTLWITFGAFLFFPTIDAPPVFGRVAIGLCASEFVAALIASVAPSCVAPGCGRLGDVAHGVAGWQIPGLTCAALVLAIAYGLRIARTW